MLQRTMGGVSLGYFGRTGTGAGGVYEAAGGVDACVARPDAVEPLGHAELEEALFGVHCEGWEGGCSGWLGSGCARLLLGSVDGGWAIGWEGRRSGRGSRKVVRAGDLVVGYRAR
jgi:hypothetical protein